MILNRKAYLKSVNPCRFAHLFLSIPFSGLGLLWSNVGISKLGYRVVLLECLIIPLGNKVCDVCCSLTVSHNVFKLYASLSEVVSKRIIFYIIFIMFKKS